ncbi:hypothetical protein L1887_62981 [Cichorium endivia]|nr:hypothetical protein L1887_62981 [Cichorium endivia]
MLERIAAGPRAAAVRAKCRSAARWCGRNLNFFRVHVLVFTFVPLIAAAIFYACNGETHINFIDALFCCVSAMTVTGLVTINISTANGGQQAILFILMCIGNISAVSVTMIWIRRHFFRRKFDHVVRRSAKVRKRMHDVEEQQRRERRHNIAKLQRMVGLKASDSATTLDDTEDADRTDSSSSGHIELRRIEKKQSKSKPKRKPLRADMIRRIDGPAFLINSAGDPSNTIPDHHILAGHSHPSLPPPQQQPPLLSQAQASFPPHPIAEPGTTDSAPRRRLSIPRFSGRHDPEADSDEEAVADEELHDTADVPMPQSPPLRARFPDHQPLGRGRRVVRPAPDALPPRLRHRTHGHLQRAREARHVPTRPDRRVCRA